MSETQRIIQEFRQLPLPVKMGLAADVLEDANQRDNVEDINAPWFPSDLRRLALKWFM